jgi:hypothetical protein
MIKEIDPGYVEKSEVEITVENSSVLVTVEGENVMEERHEVERRNVGRIVIMTPSDELFPAHNESDGE